MTLKIVTDSACDVPEELAKALEITVVPVYINIGDKSYLDGVELSRRDFYQNLPTYPIYPTTAAPASGTFAETYEKLAREGATEIISIHLADSLSATCNNARLGVEAANGVRVTVFDSTQITIGAGLLVITAAEMAKNGRSAAEVIAALQTRTSKTRIFGMIETLDSLRRSGRASWAQFGLGTLLQIKPVMMVHNGEVSVVAKIRTSKKAMQQMLDMVAELGPFEKLAVIHVNDPKTAAELQQQAAHLFPKEFPPIIMETTPAIGTHLGLGAVGFAGISA